MQTKCDSCGKYFEVSDNSFFVRHMYSDPCADSETTRICSPSCLVEYAWEEKEAQEKLSKSKHA